MKKFLKIAGAGAIAALATMISGCKVDDAYTLDNLKDIDLNVALFQNGIQLRLADSTSVFRIDSLMKTTGLDTSEFIKQNPDGSYSVKYSDKIDLGESLSDLDLGGAVSVDAIDVSVPVSYGPDLELPDGFDADALIALGQTEYTVPAISYEIEENIELGLISVQDIPDMLVGIGEIVLDEVYANIEILFTDLPGENAQFDFSATATLPSFFTPSVVELNGTVYENQVFSRQIKLEKLDLSSKDLAQIKETGEDIKDYVNITGSASTQEVTIKLVELTKNATGTVSVRISDGQGNFAIKSAQAKIDYSMDETFRSPFFSLPEELADATLDLPNASVDLTVKTNMSLPVGGSADLSAQGADSPIATLNFEVPMSADPSKYEEKTTHNEISLNKLLQEATDSIDFSAHLATDKTKYCYIEPKADYGMEFDYEISLPLKFGTGTLINFADTISLGSDAKTIGSMLRNSSIGIRANVKNTIPVSADVTVSFLSHDEESDQYTVVPLNKQQTVQLPAPGEPGLLQIVIGSEKDNEALETITDLKISFQVHSTGEALKGEDYIVLTDLYILLPNGIHFDGNKLKDKENNNE